MKSLKLLLLAIVLFVLFLPVGLVYKFVNAIREGSWKRFVAYLDRTVLSMALCFDCLANVLFDDMLNGWLRKYGGYYFGSYRETISRVLGKNKRLGTLTDAGRGLANLLDWIDPNHIDRAAND